MSKLLFLLLIAAVKVLLCKGLALGIILLLFWIKGMKLNFSSQKWDAFFLQTPPQKMQRYAAAVYLAAAAASSAVCYFILKAASYRYSLILAALLFAGGAAGTAHRWHTKGQNAFLNRYRKLVGTLSSPKSGEKNDHE